MFEYKVNPTVYKNVLRYVVPVLQNFGIGTPVFMQDTALCHKAKLAMSNYLADQGVEVMDWNAHSPDLNPIENLWKTLGQEVMARNPENLEDLWLKLVDECC